MIAVVRKVRRKFRFHIRFEADIWGLLKTTFSFYGVNRKYSAWHPKIYRFYNNYYKKSPKKRFMRFYNISSFNSKLCLFYFFMSLKKRERKFLQKKRYIYRIDIVKPEPRRKRISAKFASLRLTKMFYIVLTYRKFRAISRKAKRQDGFYESNYLMLLEGRIVSILYRLNYSSNMFNALRVVKLGVVWVNKKFRSHVNFLVCLMKFIGVHVIFKGYVYFDIIRRLIKKAIMFGFPKYVYLSTKFLMFFLKKAPKEKDLVNPISLDIHRATGYAH